SPPEEARSALALDRNHSHRPLALCASRVADQQKDLQRPVCLTAREVAIVTSMASIRHSNLSVSGIRIHVAEEGEGPLVLLVHGFPELWYSWRHQLPALADAGYRAAAIDQRGYGRSSKLWDPLEHRISRLVADALGVVRGLGEKTAVIVGH